VHIQLFDSPQVKTIAEAMDSVTVWSRAAVQTEYAQLFLPGFSDHLRPVAGAIISEMARAGAIKDGPRETAYHLSHDFDLDGGVMQKLEAIEELQNVGLVHEVFCNDDQSAWLLDVAAVANCKPAMKLEDPRKVFSVPDGPPALTWTRMECLAYLHVNGWQMHMLSTADEKGAALPLDLTFRTSDDKMIYVYKGNLLQRYLHCLCYADAEIPFPGQVETIDHFGTHTYYGKILGLDVRRQQQSRPAIADADTKLALEAVPADMFRNPQEVEPGTTASEELQKLQPPPEPELDDDNDHDDQLRFDNDDADADSVLADLECAMQADVAAEPEAAEGDGASDAAAWQVQV